MIMLLTVLTIVSAQEIREDLKKHPNWKLLYRGDDCGHSIADRIIGGDKANLGQYPWIARLGYSFGMVPEPVINSYECGGTIINNRYILTAAHCSPENIGGVRLLQVRLGEHDVTSDTDCLDGMCAPPVQDIDVEEYVCHEAYTMKALHHDICLVRLTQPIKFNEYVQPICLPTYDILKNGSFDGSVMEVAGWGVININTEKASTVLQTLKVPVLPQNHCKVNYTNRAVIIPRQLCAGGIIGKDSCGGDSGGPLMKPFSMKAPPRYFIIGIVSFGPKRCGDTATPGVYTKVSEYMEWILDHIKE